MRAMRRTIIAALTVALAVFLGTLQTGPASAGATHGYIPEDYDAAEHFAAGEGLCVPWAGTFHEVRHGGYQLVTTPGDRSMVHVNGSIDGYVELVPDDSRLASYTGTYKEKLEVVAGTIGEDDFEFERVGQYHLKSRLDGSDGSEIVLTLRGKFTINGNGRIVVERDLYGCR